MKQQLTISCRKTNLAKVRQFVSQLLDNTLQISEVEAHKMVLAVDEVCANLIIHSNKCNPTRKIEIIVELNPDQNVIFIIKDQGVSFDLSQYTEPSMEEIIASKRKGGVGLLLVRRIMDKIEFSKNKNYNICRLTKKLN